MKKIIVIAVGAIAALNVFHFLLTIKNTYQMRELKAAIDAKIEQLTGKLSNIAADVTRIKDSINPNGLTAEEAQDVVAKLDAALTQATDIDDSTPEPTEEPGTGVASSDEEVE